MFQDDLSGEELLDFLIAVLHERLHRFQLLPTSLQERIRINWK